MDLQRESSANFVSFVLNAPPQMLLMNLLFWNFETYIKPCKSTDHTVRYCFDFEEFKLSALDQFIYFLLYTIQQNLNAYFC